MKQHDAAKGVSAIDWVPQAILNLPVFEIERKCGLRFTEDWDDLDLFRGTEAFLVNGHQYVLRHYRGFPANQVSIYLPFEVDDRKEIATTVDAILKQLHLSRDVIAWERFPPIEA